MKKTIAATTLGCKVNLYDTNALLEGFVAEGYTAVDFDDFADIYVINTCSVTNLADKKSRQMVSRARQRNPLAIIAAMGCSSQASPDKFGDLGVDIIMGTSRRGDLVAHIENYSGQPIVDIAPDTNEMRSYEEEVVANDTSRTRAFLKIQDGCDSFCAYCIIPYVRGRSRSRAYDDIMKQAQNFDDAGYKEIVVAGIHVASYGKDLKGKNLLDVLGDIAALPNIQRVRLSSVEPNIITNEFCEFVAQTPKFCDHLHLSLQSGSNEILRFMNRKYTTDDFARAVEMLRQTSPDISITTDIIAGFPGEIEEHHAQTIAFLQEIQLAKLHVFPYSPKKGTAAAKMQGQITKAVKTARAKSLIELGKELEQAYAQKFLGKTMDILIEENRPEGVCVGKTRNYLTVHCTSKAPQLPNTIVAAHISKVHNGVAYGHVK